MNNGERLRQYQRAVRTCVVSIPCSVNGCSSAPFPPREFQHHFRTVHGKINVCCWCCGGENVQWMSGEKNTQARHLYDCFRRYVAGHTRSKKRADPTAAARLRKFQHRLRLVKRTVLLCPFETCDRVFLPKEMENHFKNCHFDPSIACVWCAGQIQWPPREKAQNVDHLESCFERSLFATQRKNTESSSSDEDVVKIPEFVEPRPVSRRLKQQRQQQQPRDMLGRDKLLSDDRAYGPLFQEFDPSAFPCDPSVTNSLSFQEPVETARAYLELFLAWKEETVWYHAMVSAAAFSSFVECVELFNEAVFSLPFWCWCDGGSSKYPQPLLRHHRHMILVTRKKSRFVSKCWRKITVSNRPRHYNGVRCKKIDSWLHFVNTLVYLSQTRSRCCSFSFNRGPTGHHHHYCIGTPLPDIAKLCLATWASRDGLETLLRQETRSFEVDDACCEFSDGRWWIRIENLGMTGGRDRVLPVEKRWRPVRCSVPGAAASFLHLVEGRALLFEEDLSLEKLSEMQWMSVQREGGNAFYRVVGDVRVPLNRMQQRLVNVAIRKRRQFEKEIQEVEKKEQVKRMVMEQRHSAETQQLHLELKELNETEKELKESHEKLNRNYKELMESHEKLNRNYKELMESHEKLKDLFCKTAQDTRDELAGLRDWITKDKNWREELKTEWIQVRIAALENQMAVLHKYFESTSCLK